MSADTNIIISLGSSIPKDQLQARWLHSDGGVIYLSFDTSVEPTLKQYWLEVISDVDSIIEPEFAITTESDPNSQATIKQTKADTIDGASGVYTNSYQMSWSSDGSTIVSRDPTGIYSIEIAQSAFENSTWFGDSEEAGWKSVAYHELGHALGLEHPHDSDDGDSDSIVDTNTTVMSYQEAIDTDGDPGYTVLDKKALIEIHGAESGATATARNNTTLVKTLSPPLPTRKTWKTPSLKIEYENASAIVEPTTGSTSKNIVLTRYDGYLGGEARVLLDWNKSSTLNWTDANPSANFHDVIIPKNEIIFKPFQEQAKIEITIFADAIQEGDEWLEATPRAGRRPNYFLNFPTERLRLTISDNKTQSSQSQSSINQVNSINSPSKDTYFNPLASNDPWTLYRVDRYVNAKDIVSIWHGSSGLTSPLSADLNNSKTLEISTNTWSEKVKLKSIGQASTKGDRVEAVQIDFGMGNQGSVLVGDAGNDILWGRAGWDILDGAGGDDDIHAGNGRDILTGGSGQDQLHGDFGWNTFTSSKDGARDLIAIKSDHLLYNWLLKSSGNNADGSKCDIVEGLDPIDLIKIIGVSTADLSFKADSAAHGVTGIGIYAKGALEALYTGGDLSLIQIVQMTSGDLTGPAGGSYSGW